MMTVISCRERLLCNNFYVRLFIYPLSYQIYFLTERYSEIEVLYRYSEVDTEIKLSAYPETNKNEGKKREGGI